MISIVAKITLKPGMKTEFISQTKELIEKSNQEAGCHSYQLFEDINNENVVTFIEEWQNMDAIQTHNKSAHFTNILPVFEKLQAQPLEVNLYKKI